MAEVLTSLWSRLFKTGELADATIVCCDQTWKVSLMSALNSPALQRALSLQSCDVTVSSQITGSPHHSCFEVEVVPGCSPGSIRGTCSKIIRRSTFPMLSHSLGQDLMDWSSQDKDVVGHLAPRHWHALVLMDNTSTTSCVPVVWLTSCYIGTRRDIRVRSSSPSKSPISWNWLCGTSMDKVRLHTPGKRACGFHADQ